MTTGSDVSPTAMAGQRGYADRFSADFEEIPPRETVFDTVREDDQLEQLLETAERLRESRDLRANWHGGDAEFVETLAGLVGVVEFVGQQRALEAVAEACAAVIRDGPEWGDEFSAVEIEAAQAEARDWLSHNTDAASRAGVLGEL